MSKKRVLDERFWDDEDVAQLSRDERLLLAAMITVCADDFGHLMAHPAYLRKAAFGFDDDLSTADVEQMRDRICAACRNICLYEVDGRQYIELRNFAKYQAIAYRARTTIPTPEGALLVPLGKVVREQRTPSTKPDTFPEATENSEKFLEIPETSEKFSMSSSSSSSVEKNRVEKSSSRVVNGPAAPATLLCFDLFQQETCMTMTPIVYGALADLVRQYGDANVCDAIREAKRSGKESFSLNYLAAILSRWATEGREPKKKPTPLTPAITNVDQLLAHKRDFTGSGQK